VIAGLAPLPHDRTIDPDSSWDILAWPQTAAPPQPPQGAPLWWAKVDRLSTSTTPRRSTPPTTLMGDWNIVGPSHWHLCQALPRVGHFLSIGEPTRSHNDGALLYGLAIGTLPHQPMPVVRVGHPLLAGWWCPTRS
jgi:hypothetical protein